MTNLERAQAAFAAWSEAYPTERNDDDRNYTRHNSKRGRELLDALHACGVSDHTPSLWSDGKRTVELLAMADNGLDFIAVFRCGDGNAFMPQTSFLRRFKPLAGE